MVKVIQYLMSRHSFFFCFRVVNIYNLCEIHVNDNNNFIFQFKLKKIKTKTLKLTVQLPQNRRKKEFMNVSIVISFLLSSIYGTYVVSPI
jgi:hypothetical protein